jgi:hypothetical protein
MSRVWVTFCVLLCVACGDAGSSKPAPRAPSAAVPTGPFRARALVPADTPYFVASVEPLPDDVLARYDAWMSSIVEMMRTEPGNATPLMREYLDALSGGLGQAMDRIGLGRHARFVVYGVSYFPVLRAEVASSSTLADTLEEWLSRANVPFDTTPIGGKRALAIRGEVDVVAVFPSETDVVATVVLPGETPEMVDEILAGRRPAQPLAGSARLNALTHGELRADFVGAVDVIGVLGELGYVGGSGTACEDELVDLARLAPSIEMRSAYRSDVIDMRMRVVLDRAIASRLAELRVPVPGVELPPARSPLMLVGVGLDLDALDAIIAQAAQAVRRKPFRCGMLADLNALAGELVDGIHGRIPAVLAGLRGAVVEVDRIDLGLNGGSPSGAGRALIIHDRPEEVLALLSAFVPIGEVVEAAEPVRMSMSALVPGMGDLLVARRGPRLAAAVGEDESAVTGLLQAPLPAQGPVAVFGFDMKRYMDFAASMLPTNDPSRRMFAMFEDMGFAAYALYLDESGVTLRMTMQLR